MHLFGIIFVSITDFFILAPRPSSSDRSILIVDDPYLRSEIVMTDDGRWIEGAFDRRSVQIVYDDLERLFLPILFFLDLFILVRPYCSKECCEAYHSDDHPTPYYVHILILRSLREGCGCHPPRASSCRFEVPLYPFVFLVQELPNIPLELHQALRRALHPRPLFQDPLQLRRDVVH